MNMCQSTLNHQRRNRLLEDPRHVYEYNAWDNVEWDVEQEEAAKDLVAKNSEVQFTPLKISELENAATASWDSFYCIHQNRFFKDRNWLFLEFNELSQEKNASRGETECENIGETIQLPLPKCLREEETYVGEHSNFKVLEVGCGVGNTVFPLLNNNIDPHLFVYCCDFSEIAINIIKESENFNSDRCYPFVCDITLKSWKTPFPPNSLDAIVCIFVLSAIHPKMLKNTVANLSMYLKPGGVLLFRDYGRYDMAQLRFKNGRCLAEHFYVRGDGTFCYFFTQDEVKEVMTEAGLVEVQNVADRRLQVNRGKQLKMYRVWIQGKFKKPE